MGQDQLDIFNRNNENFKKLRLFLELKLQLLFPLFFFLFGFLEFPLIKNKSNSTYTVKMINSKFNSCMEGEFYAWFIGEHGIM